MTKIIAEILATMALKFFDRAAKGPEYKRGKGPGKIEKKLRDKLKKRLSIILICALVLSGCVTRVVYVPQGQGVQLAAP